MVVSTGSPGVVARPPPCRGGWSHPGQGQAGGGQPGQAGGGHQVVVVVHGDVVHAVGAQGDHWVLVTGLGTAGGNTGHS